MANRGNDPEKIKVNGVELAYRLDGPENGHVVMLSNSLMSNYGMWDVTVPALTDRYRVLRYDTRGQGRSGATPGPYSIEMLADDAIGLIDQLGIRRVHFAGLSMGGMIAQQIGARYADRVYSLSVCDSASQMPPRSMWEERLLTAQTKGAAALVDLMIQRWFTPPFVARDPDTIEKVRRMIAATPVEGYIACASAVRDMAQTAMLLRVKSPTLIVVGRQDPACTVEDSIVLHRMIDGSEMVIIEEAAHLSNIEQPRAFNHALRAFIDRTDDAVSVST